MAILGKRNITHAHNQISIISIITIVNSFIIWHLNLKSVMGNQSHPWLYVGYNYPYMSKLKRLDQITFEATALMNNYIHNLCDVITLLYYILNFVSNSGPSRRSMECYADYLLEVSFGFYIRSLVTISYRVTRFRSCYNRPNKTRYHHVFNE